MNLADAVNNYWQVTGVQLEPDSVCTPFEHEDVTVLYRKCWRYFQRHYQPSMRGLVSGGMFNRLTFAYPTMRATPTGTSNGGTMGFYNGSTALSAAVAFTVAYSVGANSTFEADISSAGWGFDGCVAAFYQISGATFAVDLNAEL